MTTVGEILKNKRLEKKIALIDVEKTIKVRSKFLEAIEKNDFSLLPPPAFTRGFIKNYAAFLGLNTDEVLAFYRRQVNVDKIKILPEQKSEINRKIVLTPALFTAAAVGFMLLLFFGYLFRQFLLYSGTPALVIDKPADYTILKFSPLEISGRTDPGVILTINGQQVTISQNGKFSASIDLSPGLNSFEIVARNKFEKETKIARHVRLESP